MRWLPAWWIPRLPFFRLVEALTSIGGNINALSAAGARRFLILNAPNLGLVPALAAFPAGRATRGDMPVFDVQSWVPWRRFRALRQLPGLADIAASLEGSGAEVTLVDVFSFISGVAAFPEAYGITDVSHACVKPLQPPYECENPNDRLFWDGIHPDEGRTPIACDTSTQRLRGVNGFRRGAEDYAVFCLSRFLRSKGSFGHSLPTRREFIKRERAIFGLRDRSGRSRPSSVFRNRSPGDCLQDLRNRWNVGSRDRATPCSLTW